MVDKRHPELTLPDPPRRRRPRRQVFVRPETPVTVQLPAQEIPKPLLREGLLILKALAVEMIGAGTAIPGSREGGAPSQET